jgi:two-component system phosphate regulon sensor histidine kinase PhoR
MQSIVSDLLLLSRLETGDVSISTSEVAVPALLDILREDAGLLSNDQHQFEVDIDRDLWLQGNRDDLQSAFSNLLFNAVRYTPNGGKITIRWYADDAGAHLDISDSGIGIAPQHIPRLTERFYRVDVGRSRDVGGTGLGLAIVKHVLLRHHASLAIQSEMGEGSTFSCHFPPELVLLKGEGGDR